MVLGSHTLVEIVLGLLIGSVALAVFAWCYSRCEAAEVSLRPLLLVSVLVAILLNGSALNAEEVLHAMSIYLNARAPLCMVGGDVLSR